MENEQHILTDIEVLLAFLKEETSEQCGYEAQVTSLQTLSNMCTNEGADILNKCGGISLILKLCWDTKHNEVCQACLYTLACGAESNDQVQATLCSENLFGSMKAVMEGDNVPQRTQLLCIYFLASLVSRNKKGQDLMRSSGCLEKLLRILASGIQVATSDKCKTENIKRIRELWKVTAKALIYTINIPQNETNQKECSKCFRHVISILHETRNDTEIVMESCKFLSAALDNNEYCRKTALSCRLLEVLIIRLQSSNVTNNGKVIGELVTTLSNLLPEKGDDCERFGNLGGILLLIDLLKDPSELAITVHQTNHIIAVLLRCANASEKNRQQLIKLNTANVLARLMKCVHNNECFNKLAVYLLNQCLPENSPNSQEAKTDNFEEDIFGVTEAKPSENSQIMSAGDEESLVEDDEKDSHSKSVIDLLQTEMNSLKRLLLQVNDKQEKSAKKLEEIYKQNSVTSLSSDNLPEPGHSQQMSSVKNLFCKPAKTANKKSIQGFLRSCSRPDTVQRPKKGDTSHIMTSTLLASPEHQLLSPNFQSEGDLSFHKEENSRRSVFVINDQGVHESTLKSLNNCEQSCGNLSEFVQKKQNEMSKMQNIIDVERLSPGHKVCERITKYYVKTGGKIRQHVIKHRSSVRAWTPAPSRHNIRQLEEDVLSQCSDVTMRKNLGYVRKSNSEFHPQKNKHSSYQEGKASAVDVFRFYPSRTDNTAFKKPALPRFQTRSNCRVKYSAREEKNLEEGVKNLGPNWKDILYAYDFHPTRTSVDLKDKYRNILRKKEREKLCSLHF